MVRDWLLTVKLQCHTVQQIPLCSIHNTVVAEQEDGNTKTRGWCGSCCLCVIINDALSAYKERVTNFDHMQSNTILTVT